MALSVKYLLTVFPCIIKHVLDVMFQLDSSERDQLFAMCVQWLQESKVSTSCHTGNGSNCDVTLNPRGATLGLANRRSSEAPHFRPGRQRPNFRTLHC